MALLVIQEQKGFMESLERQDFQDYQAFCPLTLTLFDISLIQNSFMDLKVVFSTIYNFKNSINGISFPQDPQDCPENQDLMDSLVPQDVQDQ